MKYIDSHIHLEQYSEQEQALMLKDSNTPALLFSCGMDLETNERTLRLNERYPQVQPVLGLHPEYYQMYNQLEEVKKQIIANIHKVSAIGEIGMPYYSLEDKTLNEKKEIIIKSQQVLGELLDIAKVYEKPVVLHVIFDHVGYVLKELKERNMKNVVFHWFEGSAEDLKTIIQEGYYMSVSPEVMHDEKYAEFVDKIPLELMVLESDGPWPYNGKKGVSEMILEVINFLAIKRKLSNKKLSEQIYMNTLNCFQCND